MGHISHEICGTEVNGHIFRDFQRLFVSQIGNAAIQRIFLISRIRIGSKLNYDIHRIFGDFVSILGHCGGSRRSLVNIVNGMGIAAFVSEGIHSLEFQSTIFRHNDTFDIIHPAAPFAANVLITVLEGFQPDPGAVIRPCRNGHISIGGSNHICHGGDLGGILINIAYDVGNSEPFSIFVLGIEKNGSIFSQSYRAAVGDIQPGNPAVNGVSLHFGEVGEICGKSHIVFRKFRFGGSYIDVKILQNGVGHFQRKDSILKSKPVEIVFGIVFVIVVGGGSLRTIDHKGNGNILIRGIRSKNGEVDFLSVRKGGTVSKLINGNGLIVRNANGVIGSPGSAINEGKIIYKDTISGIPVFQGKFEERTFRHCDSCTGSNVEESFERGPACKLQRGESGNIRMGEDRTLFHINAPAAIDPNPFRRVGRSEKRGGNAGGNNGIGNLQAFCISGIIAFQRESIDRGTLSGSNIGDAPAFIDIKSSGIVDDPIGESSAGENKGTLTGGEFKGDLLLLFGSGVDHRLGAIHRIRLINKAVGIAPIVNTGSRGSIINDRSPGSGTDRSHPVTGQVGNVGCPPGIDIEISAGIDDGIGGLPAIKDIHGTGEHDERFIRPTAIGNVGIPHGVDKGIAAQTALGNDHASAGFHKSPIRCTAAGNQELTAGVDIGMTGKTAFQNMSGTGVIDESIVRCTGTADVKSAVGTQFCGNHKTAIFHMGIGAVDSSLKQT